MPSTVARKKRARSLHQALSTTDGFSEIAARVQAMVDVQQVLNAGWPALDLQVVSIRAGVLSLRCNSAALAAKARQSEPSLLASAQRAFAPIQSVRIKARRQSMGAQIPRPRTTNPISEHSLSRLEQASQSLSAGPLRDALLRMTDRHRNERRD